jgi:hypothetical protein
MRKQILIGSVVLCALVALGFAVEDKYSLKVPDGLAFSDFRGYEGWQTVAWSRTEAQNVVRVMLANPVPRISASSRRFSRKKTALGAVWVVLDA